jgi:CheY-like chemotaxis protein/signal transduction histidine kinase
MLTRDRFLRELRGALTHLYDPDYLRQSPVADLFGLANRFDTAAALQRILTEAIEALEPKDGDASDRKAWQIYEPLHCCYVEQMSQQEVADQMGICVRHLRRKQRAALGMLADRLWQQVVETADASPAQAREEVPATGIPTVEDELSWLKETAPETPVNLQDVLVAMTDRAAHLASQRGVRLQVAPRRAEGDALPDLAVHQPALEHALLNLVSIAIHAAAAGASPTDNDRLVRVSARRAGQEVSIDIFTGSTQLGRWALSTDDAASLDIAQRLAELCGGRLTLVDAPGFAATLTIPALEKASVLAIDDNADTLQLLQRYTAGTRFHLLGTRDPEQAINLAVKLSPAVIVLDVMMPRVDGWEVLARLRQHPGTAHIPVIVCTILPQEDLALSMGASGYIRKPVARQGLLAALNLQIERMAPVSR